MVRLRRPRLAVLTTLCSCCLAVTFLHQAARHNKLELVRWLLINGAEVNARAEDGVTALHMAVRSIQSTLAALCRNMTYVLPNPTSPWLPLPLQIESLPNEDALACCRQLVASGADLNLLNSSGQTAAEAAALKGTARWTLACSLSPGLTHIDALAVLTTGQRVLRHFTQVSI